MKKPDKKFDEDGHIIIAENVPLIFEANISLIGSSEIENEDS